MKLLDALTLIGARTAGQPFEVSLACGIEPLHLRTLLAGELCARLPGARPAVTTGSFDDLAGNIRRAGDLGAGTLAVVIEWADLDPRLGLRRLGGWRVDQLDEIVAEAEATLERLSGLILTAAVDRRVVVAQPTLPLPPLFPPPPGQDGPTALALRAAVAGAMQRLARGGVHVINAEALDAESSGATRRDVQAELTSGFPYTLAHAGQLAAALAELIDARPPRKGLITDLDQTFWAGTLDEAGSDGVRWDLDSGTQRHGIYQQFLASLASAGVLIAVASRNDPDQVAAALGRRDLAIDPSSIFPVEVGWGRKSDSVARILAAWNVAPAAVVFVDDDRLELDEVRRRFPGVETRALPPGDDGMWALLLELRSLFGKAAVQPEDSLRLASLRAAPAVRAGITACPDGDDFLASVAGVLEFGVDGPRRDRALELFGKTNQFNLNGRRVDQAALAEAMLLTVSYEDRYGPLGMVGALLVATNDEGAQVTAWALSCRAFNRRVEAHMLSYLFDRLGVEEVRLAYRPTRRNQALETFLVGLLGKPLGQEVRITRARLTERAPALVHRVREAGG